MNSPARDIRPPALTDSAALGTNQLPNLQIALDIVKKNPEQALRNLQQLCSRIEGTRKEFGTLNTLLKANSADESTQQLFLTYAARLPELIDQIVQDYAGKNIYNTFRGISAQIKKAREVLAALSKLDESASSEPSSVYERLRQQTDKLETQLDKLREDLNFLLDPVNLTSEQYHPRFVSILAEQNGRLDPSIQIFSLALPPAERLLKAANQAQERSIFQLDEVRSLEHHLRGLLTGNRFAGFEQILVETFCDQLLRIRENSTPCTFKELARAVTKLKLPFGAPDSIKQAFARENYSELKGAERIAAVISQLL